ncbi:MAG TPA: glycosyl hydrolase family 28 protein [Terriglobales bacterium]|nr:glycosyl hydrolase family 28 protein [Terriglobales bacterium]
MKGSLFGRAVAPAAALLLLSVGLLFPGPRAAAAQGFTLTIGTLGSGTVSVNPVGPYAAGTLVTLTASPASGWSFSSWSGNLIGHAAPGTLIVNGNDTVTATFDQNGYQGITGDTRTLTEPTFPAVCTQLLAQQSASSLNQSRFDTARLQSGLNGCPAGRAVELSSSGADNAFLTQPGLTLPAGVTLLIDADVTLFGDDSYNDYHCTSSTCTPLISVAGNSASAAGSAIMGYGTIDGQGSFCWSLASDDGARCPRMITLGIPSYGDQLGGYTATSDSFTLYKVTLQNSPNFLLFGPSNGLVVWGAKFRNPARAPNGDCLDPSGSDITIQDSFFSCGDDHIAFKAGTVAVHNATVAHNHLYYGHGLSIGSETNAGMSNMLATDNVINQNGCSGCSSSNDVRIKSDVSRGGEVKNILYQDTCIRNGGSQPHEFVFNTHYTPDVSGSLTPFFHDISIHNVHMVDAGNSSTIDGFDATHILTTRWDNVALDAINSSDFGSSHTDNTTFTLGSGPVSFAATVTKDAPSDTRVTVVNAITSSAPTYDCTGRFIFLAGELFTGTPSIAAGSSVALTSVLEQAIIEKAAPTGTIEVLEGANVVASARISGRNTVLTIPNVSAGTHSYSARYDGDANYGTQLYGPVVVTAH